MIHNYKLYVIHKQYKTKGLTQPLHWKIQLSYTYVKRSIMSNIEVKARLKFTFMNDGIMQGQKYDENIP